MIPYRRAGGLHGEVARASGPLLAAGIESIAVVPHGSGRTGLFDSDVEVIEADVARPTGNGSQILSHALASLRSDTLAGVLLENRVDVVRTFGIHNPQGLVAARRVRIPAICTIASDFVASPILEVGVMALAPLVHRYLVTGAGLVRWDRLPRRVAARGVAYYPQIDGRIRFRARDRYTPDGVLRVGALSKVTSQKRLDMLVAAVGCLYQGGCCVDLTVAGAIEQPSELEKIHVAALRSGLVVETDVDPSRPPVAGAVRLLGRVEGIPGFLSEMDVVAFTSAYEGVPASLLEGLAAGVPVVSTPVGSIPALAESVTGLTLSAPNPSPASFGRSIVEALAAPPEEPPELGPTQVEALIEILDSL